MSKFYTVLRQFDEENEPKMGPQEAAVLAAIAGGNPEDKPTTEREAVVARLKASIDAGEFETTQEAGALLSFQQRQLQLRGLIGVETVSEGGKGGKAKKDTLTKKKLVRLREFDAEKELKMSPHEEMVYKHIPEAGALREDVIAAIQAEIDAGTFETVQKPATIVSFNQAGLRKRGLIAIENVEVPRGDEPASEESTEEKPKRSKKQAAS